MLEVCCDGHDDVCFDGIQCPACKMREDHGCDECDECDEKDKRIAELETQLAKAKDSARLSDAQYRNLVLATKKVQPHV